MSQISRFLRKSEDGGLMYWCQGCEMLHHVKVGDGSGPRWGYNGNPDKSTFTPSVLTQYDHWTPPAYPGWDPVPQTKVSTICHTFITDGKVQFLGDCTHQFAGQTLDLPELPGYLQDEKGTP